MLELIGTDIEVVCDWLEISLLELNDFYSKSSIIKMLEQGFDMTPEVAALRVDEVQTEFEYRIKLYGEKSPFMVTGSRFLKSLNLIDTSIIEELKLCLLFSYLGAKNEMQGTRIFEQMTSRLFGLFFNFNLRVLGTSRSDARTKSLKQVISEVLVDIGLGGAPKLDKGQKDAGVDFIAYKKFNDMRSVQLAILGQCGAGKTWNSKQTINVRAWRRYLGDATALDIVLCLIIAEVVEKNEWQEKTEKFGIVIDRPRIYRMLTSINIRDMSVIHDEVSAWVLEKLNKHKSS